MPAIHIQLSSAPLPEVQIEKVAQRVLEITERVLHKAPAVTAVFIDALPAARWWIGGENLLDQARSSYCVTIRITDETNTKVEKAQYLCEVHTAMQELLGPIHPCSYVHVQDVRATAYGYGGQTQEERYQAALQMRSTSAP